MADAKVIDEIGEKIDDVTKYAINSTLGTPEFMPISDMINEINTKIGNRILFETAGTYQWIVPAGISELIVIVAGAGGSGSSLQGTTNSGGGGSGGNCVMLKITVSGGQIMTFTIGKGGVAVKGVANGNAGSATVLNDYVTCAGGNGAVSSVGGISAGSGSGAGGHGNDRTILAGDGLYGKGGVATVDTYAGGGGGGSYGNGGNGSGVKNADNGKHGSGGGGSRRDYYSGNGGDGAILFSWGLVSSL